MAFTTDDNRPETIGQADFQDLLHEKIRQAVRFTLVTILEAEVEALIGAAPYQRSQERRDHRNGYYSRDLGTSAGVIEDLEVPRTRKGYKTQLFERYHRRRAELDEAIAEMFIQGVSTQRVGQVLDKATDVEVSASTVSRVFHTLEEEFNAWRKRPLEAEYAYAFADGTYFSVIYDGKAHHMPVLVVVGISRQGKREVLGFSSGDRENQAAWEEALEDLKRRGVRQIDLWITDGHQAMLNAIETKFRPSRRQRCIKHKMDNVLGYVPKSQHEQVRAELKTIFYQKGREQADQQAAAFIEKYGRIYPSAVECLERDLVACLTFYDFPHLHWKTIRTTNIIERMFGEVKKRSHKMATAFRNEKSCLLMFYAIIRGLTFNKLSMPAKDLEPILHTT